MRISLLILIAALGTGAVAAQETPRVSGDSSAVEIVLWLTPRGSFTDSVLVDYAGVWTVGFEENRLTPCGNWTPDSLGGVAFVPGRIGLGPSAGGRTFAGLAQPDSSFFLPRMPPGALPAFFVRGTGWLVGPGAYGHFGGTLYTIKTKDLVELRWAMPGDCGVGAE